MVGGDVGDEVGGVVEGDGAVGNGDGGGGVHGEALEVIDFGDTGKQVYRCVAYFRVYLSTCLLVSW
jgi:hypothetical protein